MISYVRYKTSCFYFIQQVLGFRSGPKLHGWWIWHKQICSIMENAYQSIRSRPWVKVTCECLNTAVREATFFCFVCLSFYRHYLKVTSSYVLWYLCVTAAVR